MKIALQITNQCLHQCWFCYAESVAMLGKIIPYAEIKRLVETMDKNKVTLHIGGGEPTEHPEIDKIIRLLEDSNTKYSITTNLDKPQKLEIVNKGTIWASVHHLDELDSIVTKLNSLPAKDKGVIILVMRSTDPYQLKKACEEIKAKKLGLHITFFKANGRGKKARYEELNLNEKRAIIKHLCEIYGIVSTDSCMPLTGKERCTCGKTWVTITPELIVKPNSFVSYGRKIETLDYSQILTAVSLFPKGVNWHQI